jgi:putative ABC transport system permease protein
MRLCVRTLAKKPWFSIGVILMLALGTGLNAAMFGIIHSVVFQPLFAKSPEQLVTLSQKASAGISIPDLEDLRAQNRSFQAMEGYIYSGFTFRGGSGSELVIGAEVTPGYLNMLGEPPLAGTTFVPGQAENSVVLSEAFWKSRFGADRKVIGSAINLNGQPYIVLGVMPKELKLPYDAVQLWTPVPAGAPWKQNRGIHALRLLARLKAGISVQDALADMSLLTRRLAQLYPKEDGGRSVIVIGLHDAMVSDIRPKLYLLFFAGLFIFLIAAANVASLSLTRASDRLREIAIRKALGASRSHLIYQLVVENAVLALLGSALGWILAAWWVQVIIALKPSRLPRLHEIHLDSTVLLSLIVSAFVIAAMLAAVNIIEFERLNLNDVLATGGRGNTGGSRRWLRKSLIGVEMGVAVMLLIGNGLLIRSFENLFLVDAGFEAKNRIVMHLSLPEQTRTAKTAVEVYEPIYEKIKSLPGVDAVGFSNVLPLQGGFDAEYFIKDRTPPNSHNSAQVRIVNQEYFQAMGIVLVSGRQFTAQDDANAPKVAIINRRMAKQWFQDKDPIGHHIRTLGKPGWITIVGVVADVHDNALEAGPPLEFFIPYRQNPYAPAMWNAGLVVKTQKAPSAAAAPVKQTIHSVNPAITLFGISTMEDTISDSLRDRRLAMTLLTVFSALALILATYGVYALLAYSVHRQTREIGVRMAMGADRWTILRHITFQGMRVALAGLMAGTIGAYILARLLTSLLFGVTATDAVTFVLSNVLLLITSVCATLLPAWRGARLDPLKALRFE